MRRGILLLAIAALLALPGVTLAQVGAPIGEVHYNSATVAPLDGGAVQFDPTIHSSIIVDIVITDPGILQMYSAYYFLSADLNGGGITTGDGDWTYDASNAKNYTGMDGASGDLVTGGIAGGLTLAGAGNAGIEQYSFGTALPSPVSIVSHEILLTGSPIVGDQYVLHSDSLTTGYPSSGVTPGVTSFESFGMNIGFVGGVPLVVDIVPEPATALLLLGALPFLRRRR